MKSNQIEAKQNKDGKENRHYTTGIITLHNGKTKQNKTKQKKTVPEVSIPTIFVSTGTQLNLND